MNRRVFFTRLAAVVAWPVVIAHHRVGHARGPKPEPSPSPSPSPSPEGPVSIVAPVAAAAAWMPAGGYSVTVEW